jgi:hypothetical protein
VTPNGLVPMKRIVAAGALLLTLTACGAASVGTTPEQAAADKSEALGSSAPAVVLPALDTAARAKSELRDKFSDRVMSIKESGGQFTLALKAPDVFIKSVMASDAKDAFRQVYKDAGYAPKEMLVMFHGTLVVKATGAESDGVFAVYDITRKQAARIVWANQDEIDWTHYRTMQRSDL